MNHVKKNRLLSWAVLIAFIVTCFATVASQQTQLDSGPLLNPSTASVHSPGELRDRNRKDLESQSAAILDDLDPSPSLISSSSVSPSDPLFTPAAVIDPEDSSPGRNFSAAGEEGESMPVNGMTVTGTEQDPQSREEETKAKEQQEFLSWSEGKENVLRVSLARNIFSALTMNKSQDLFSNETNIHSINGSTSNDTDNDMTLFVPINKAVRSYASLIGFQTVSEWISSILEANKAIDQRQHQNDELDNTNFISPEPKTHLGISPNETGWNVTFSNIIPFPQSISLSNPMEVWNATKTLVEMHALPDMVIKWRDMIDGGSQVYQTMAGSDLFVVKDLDGVRVWINNSAPAVEWARIIRWNVPYKKGIIHWVTKVLALADTQGVQSAQAARGDCNGTICR